MGVLTEEPVQGHAGRTGRVPALDGVRGIAVLLVMLFHLDPLRAPGGAVGVDVFFVLSGFLITDILLAERAATGGLDKGAFYVRRAARLLPALVVFLVLVAPVASVAAGLDEYIWSNTLMSLFYVSDVARALDWPGHITQVYGHTWSLAVEEQFYLVWPFLLVLALRRGVPLVRLGVALWVVGVVATVATSHWVGVGQDYFLPTGHLHALAIGCLVAFAFHTGRRGRWWASAPAALLAAPALAAATVLHRETWAWWLSTASNVVLMLAVACLVAHCATGRSPVTRLLSSGALTWVGRRSYALYLFHPVFAVHFPGSPIGGRTMLVLGILLSFVLAELSFRFVEDPIMRRTRAWLRRTR